MFPWILLPLRLKTVKSCKLWTIHVGNAPSTMLSLKSMTLKLLQGVKNGILPEKLLLSKSLNMFLIPNKYRIFVFAS